MDPIEARTHPSRSRGRALAVNATRWILALISMACGPVRSSPLIERHDVQSVPELLATLPESLWSRYVLVRQSRSPQPATDQAPRAILFSEDAKLVVAFDGTSESVDVMTFDDTTRAFSFREITFPDVGGRTSMAMSEPNPARCRACHGTPARPIWDPYPLWPGTYGESDALPLPDEEQEQLARFAASRPSHPRYRFLRPPRRETRAEGTERRYLGQVELSRNAELTSLLGALNATAVAAELRASPYFDQYRYALLAALIPRCGDVAEASLAQAGGPSQTYASFEAETRRANANQEEATRYRARGQPLSRPPADDRAMIRLRYVAEHALGVSARSWTLALEKGSFEFTSSPGRASSFEAQLFAAIAGSDERLVGLYWQGSDTTLVCAYLGQHSRAAQRLTAASSPAAIGRAEVEASRDLPVAILLDQCASCHEQGVGPPIPFHDRDALSDQLTARTRGGRSLLEEVRFRLEPRAGAGRMPLNLNPSEESRSRLLGYLVGLRRVRPRE